MLKSTPWKCDGNMLTRILVLVLTVQRNLILSEEVTNEKPENIRASRQLNFGDCCPCPGQDVFQDQYAANRPIETASADDSCPCRPSPDSESASSIFSPAFRTVEPFVRPVSKKEEPKPLLNPEVGLASSVLETLREVTDQEYQEALARDAARSTLRLMDPELAENEARNVVNIILSPKKEYDDDIISEATDNQGSCILPPLSMKNNLEHLRLQPPMKLLKQILTPSKLTSAGILNRNRSDMDGSASDTQERILQPLKNNILENIRTRSNLLNLRPFSNIDSRDFLTSPTIFQKHYLKNNVKDRMLLNNKSLLDMASKTPNNKLKALFAKNNPDKKILGMEQDEISDWKKKSAVSFGNNEKKLKVTTEDNLFQNADCMQTITEPNVAFKDYEEDFDAVPSSSKIIEVENQSFTESPNIIEQDTESYTCSDKVLNTDTDPNNSYKSQAITELNIIEVTTEAVQDTEDVRTLGTEIENTTEDIDSEPSTVVENFRDAVDSECTSSTKEKNKLQNADTISTNDVETAKSAEKEMINSEIGFLPNIKADIFRTLENFKKANEIIQEKLRSNVQDALKLVNANEPDHSTTDTGLEPQSEMRTSSVEETQKKITNTQIDMSTQDLQKMSDSILELSSLKDNAETSTTSNCKNELIEEKSAEVGKASEIEDLITLPTSWDGNNKTFNLKNEKFNLTIKDEHVGKTDETIGKCVNYIIPMSPASNNEDNEMNAQPSNSVYNSIPQLDTNPTKSGFLQRDIIVQPEDSIRPLDGIKNFFNGFRSLGIDSFTNNERDFYDSGPLYEFHSDENIDFSKNFAKSNSDSSLSSYKAKVASPKSLDIKSLVPTGNEADVLGIASQRVPHNVNFGNLIRNNFENGLNPLFKSEHTPKMLQNTFSSIAPRISENFKSHTNNALKTFRDSLDVGDREPFKFKNNLLGKPLINSDNLLEAVLKTHGDFNDKLQAFHSDINNRLSSISPRMTSEGSRLLWTSSRLKNSKNMDKQINIPRKNSGTISTKTSFQKNTLPLKNKLGVDLIKQKLTGATTPKSYIATDRLRHNIKQKFDILPHQTDSATKKGPNTITLSKNFLNTKNRPKNNLKLKPLKENKVTISFASTSIRPDTLKSGFKPLQQMDSLRSRSTGDFIKFPTISKSLGNKKTILKSKLEPNEPKVLASDISVSKTQFPGILGKSKIKPEISTLEESERSQNENKSYGDRLPTNVSEENKRKSFLLSKIKNAFAPGISNDHTKGNNKDLLSRQKEQLLDATQSASNNVDSSISEISVVGETTKDNNQSFKCKMVCFKDFFDLTDS